MNNKVFIRITMTLPIDKSECSLKVGDVVEVVGIKEVSGARRLAKRKMYVVIDPVSKKKLCIYFHEAEEVIS